MRFQNPFAVISPVGLDSQVLTVLARSDHYMTAPEIHRHLPEGGSSNGVRNALARLVEIGTVLEAFAGRISIFALNREHLLAESITQFANAKRTFIEKLAAEITDWETQPISVTMFGSAARNDMQSNSDIDLLFILSDDLATEPENTALSDLVSKASQWTGNDIRPLVYFASEVTDASVFSTILEDGIHIAGNRNWLRRKFRNAKRATWSAQDARSRLYPQT